MLIVGYKKAGTNTGFDLFIETQTNQNTGPSEIIT